MVPGMVGMVAMGGRERNGIVAKEERARTKEENGSLTWVPNAPRLGYWGYYTGYGGYYTGY